MNLTDIIQFALQTLTKQTFKTIMLLIAISIGVISVVLLTGLGEGGRQFVLSQFSSLGNNTLVMVPGRKETEGGLPPLTGESQKPLTIEDAHAISKLPGINHVAPLVAGNVEISTKQSGDNKTLRNTNLAKISIVAAGTTAEMLEIMDISILRGKNFHDSAWQVSFNQVLLGSELAQQIFRHERAVGKWIRLADRRFLVTGIIHTEGANLGLNFNKMALIPVHAGTTLFNTQSLLRTFIQLTPNTDLESIKKTIIHLMTTRQGGTADVTLISQDAIVSSFNDIMLAINLAIAAIGTISLIVAGILIMNVSLISVTQRTKEIGLLRALGAHKYQIKALFITEASLLAILGATAGIIVSNVILYSIEQQYPTLSFTSPWWATVSAYLLAILSAIMFAWAPASRAARINIISALSGRKDDDN